MSWLYVRLYPSAPESLSRVTSYIQEWRHIWRDASRWFYLHFADALGVHVRLRISSDGLEFLDDVYLKLLRATAQVDVTMIPDLYERELSKWGVGAMAYTETVFEATSVSCLELRGVPGVNLSTAASAFFELSRRSWGCDDDTWLAFCRTHVAWWRAESTTRGHEIADFTQYLPMLSTWGEALSEMKSAYLTSGRSYDYYVHHHLHLICNRLGLSTVQEAQVADGCAVRVSIKRSE